jgi:alpha-tubulin suppressor-like RCC1 family protein
VKNLSNVIDVSAGSAHTCAVDAGGAGYCWGLNRFGRLGDGTTTDSALPVRVANLTTVERIDAGLQHTCALMSGKWVACWGNNSMGELGNRTTVASSYAVRVSDLVGVSVLAVTGELSLWGHNCAITDGGTASCWGYNGHGEIGNGNLEPQSTPVLVGTMRSLTGLSLGAFRSYGITAEGDVLLWGLDWSSQTYATLPVPVDGLTEVVDVAAGVQHTCALTAYGRVLCFGKNDRGQLGDGSTTDRSAPSEVLGIGEVVEISAGRDHTCSRTVEGIVYCWGDNSGGQLGTTSIELSANPLVAFLANAGS